MKRLCWLVVVACGACSDGIAFPPGSEWPPAPVGEWVGQERFAVTVNLSDQIAYLPADGVRSTVMGAVAVGNSPAELEGPHHIAAAPDGSALYYNLSNYVPGAGSGPHGAHGSGNVPGSLVRLDARTSQKIGEVLVDRSPGDVILSKDGSTAFVSHYDLLRLATALATGAPVENGYSAVAVVDTASMKRLALLPVCATAHGEGLSLDEKTLYVTCSQSDELAILDVSDRARPSVKSRVGIGPAAGPVGQPTYGPYALSVSPKDGSVWISNNNSGDVRVFDPATGQMDPARVIPTGGVAMFGAFSPDGATFYVPHQGDDRLTVVNASTLEKTVVPMPQGACLNAHAFVLAPSGAMGVLVCEGDHLTKPGTVVTITTSPLSIVGFATVGTFPDGAAFLRAVP